MSWEIFSGGVVGGFHRLRGVDYQDAHEWGVEKDVLAGFVTDGCGSSVNSKVGAQLAVRFLTDTVLRMAGQGNLVGKWEEMLFVNLVDYLDSLVMIQGCKTEEQKQRFVLDYLLFTVLGVVITKDKAVILTCGDGVVMINNFSSYIDQDNLPTYPGYCLIKDQLGNSVNLVPEGFLVWELEVEEIDCLAITTDAFKGRLSLLEQIKGCENQNQLQLKLNKWSLIEELLDDDASVVMVKRK